MIHDIEGHTVKIRPDLFGQSALGGYYSVNWKTASAMSMWEGWGRRFQYSYLPSAGFYQLVYDRVFGPGTVTQIYPVVLCAPSEPPLIQVYTLSQQTAEFGVAMARQAIRAIGDAEIFGDWSHASEVAEL